MSNHNQAAKPSNLREAKPSNLREVSFTDCRRSMKEARKLGLRFGTLQEADDLLDWCSDNVGNKGYRFKNVESALYGSVQARAYAQGASQLYAPQEQPHFYMR